MRNLTGFFGATIAALLLAITNTMKTTGFLRFSFATLALLLCLGVESSAQILYIQLASNDPVRFQLRQVNGDGSGDVPVGMPFADVRFPAWSRDAGFFAISSPNPNRPSERSFNVYAINTANGGITQITAFQDIVADSQTGTFRWNYPFHKAFSPDRGAMAVSSLIVQGSRGATTTSTPVLEVYSTATPVNPLLVHVHTNYTGLSHHAGEGVDWSPIQNVLVTPVETSARYQSGGNNFNQVTALYLLDPVDGAIQQGRARQITFPRTDAGSNTSDAFNWSEHDYQPKFSPNGVGVAYVRSFQNFSLSRGGRDPNFQSLRILNLSTNAETEVLQLPQGGYVTSLDWSADGTALVFSFGQQESGVNGLQQSAVPQTNELYVVNLDGTGVRRLRGAGATTPAWKPLAGGRPTPSGNNVTVGSPNGDASVTFPVVSQPGTTSFAPINPSSAGTPPAGFTVLNNAPAFDITTTAVFTPPVTVCHIVNSINDAATFARVRILHGEGGQLVDRTIRAPDAPAPDFATRRVCARSNSLSPFVTALAPAATPPLVINALADSYVVGADASRNTNFGASTELQVKRTLNPGAGRGRRGFLKFDLTNVTTVSNARMRLFVRLSDASLANIPLRIQKVANTSWEEFGVTWNTQPDVAAPDAIAPDLVVLDGTGRFYDYDLTSFIKAERAAGRNVVAFRFINMAQTGTSGAFYTAINSKEAPTGKPQLIIEQ